MTDPIQTLDFHGYAMERRDDGGLTRLLVAPKGEPARDAEGRPLWYWNVRFWGAFPFVDLGLLARGWHVAHVTVDELYGSPESMRRMDALYDEMVSRGFSRRVALVGMSRGGLDSTLWAVRHPERVSTLHLDNPVLTIRSWPCCAGASRGSDPEAWARCKAAWGFADDAEALAWRGNPLDAAVPALARGRVPVLLLVGTADDVVPPDENALPFAEALRAEGAELKVVEKPGAGHHPHGLEPPDELVDWVCAHAVASPLAPGGTGC